MSIFEIFVVLLLFIILLNNKQQKFVIKKLKHFYKQTTKYKHFFQQTINNKIFSNVDCVEKSKITNINIDYNPFTDNFVPKITKTKTNSKNQPQQTINKKKNKKLSTKPTQQTN